MITHRCFSVRHRCHEGKHLCSSRNFGVRERIFFRQTVAPMKTSIPIEPRIARSIPIQAKPRTCQGDAILILQNDFSENSSC